MTPLLAQLERLTASKGWQTLAGLWPALIAVALPWSTSAVPFILVIWLIGILGMLRWRPLLELLSAPAAYLPIAFFALGLLGMFWTDDSWPARFQGLQSVARLLLIPLLLYQYKRSEHPHWVFYGFLASCSALMLLSWLIYFFPQLRFTTAHGFDTTGIPVRNSIDQTYEFALCCFGLLFAVKSSFERRMLLPLTGFALLLIAFALNLLVVALSRTAILYTIPVLLLFAYRYFEGRVFTGALVLLGASLMLAWFSSPLLQDRVSVVKKEYREYVETNRPTSLGQRLTYWDLSLGWIKQAPLLGHGTGATKRLFEQEALGKEGAWADAIRNPHNQTLYVAIQWGLLGCLVLYAMWFSHFRLFGGVDLAAWIGASVVVQNFFSSMLNSHLFDFVEGWIYIFGIGVAGGMVLKRTAKSAVDR